ncbi:cytosolic phospholipase A2 gamma-like [Pygocentrus nattereri]|uniref:cytosolic phospholipase A2 gamma-like n=1 Tax=Pygocentrus nattereri TaxID=42514 RepID=UPI001890FC73|nr:cytosolic phospholipase A2 gamma-like [Pygocentrus nattereri]
MVNEIDEHKLTEQRANYTNDPYPIYTVIDKQCKYDTLNADVWFEITPDESGYSLPGAFVDSSCWGSQFKSGERIKDQPETDMLYLQGLCGSAIADMEENKKFLYEALKQLIELEYIDPSVLDSETRQYEDAGLLLNSPYFSVLRKERHIDLIISLDFSAGNPFETVVTTAKMCKHLQIPFPEVVVPAEDTEPQDFYVFRGYSKAPTVIHIPLFNVVNCKGEIKKWEKIYKTFQMSYTHEMITDLLEKAAENIKNNKEKLLKEIIKIIQEKKTYKHGKI